MSSVSGILSVLLIAGMGGCSPASDKYWCHYQTSECAARFGKAGRVDSTGWTSKLCTFAFVCTVISYWLWLKHGLEWLPFTRIKAFNANTFRTDVNTKEMANKKKGWEEWDYWKSGSEACLLWQHMPHSAFCFCPVLACKIHSSNDWENVKQSISWVWLFTKILLQTGDWLIALREGLVSSEPHPGTSSGQFP